MSSHPSFRPSRPSPDMLLRTTGQVARLPVVEARGTERRVVNLAADLREPGSSLVDVEVMDLSQEGFAIRGVVDVEPGATVWLKLAGFAPMKSEVIWFQDGKAGCRFITPLYKSILEEIIESQPKAGVKRLFTPPGPGHAELPPQAEPDAEAA